MRKRKAVKILMVLGMALVIVITGGCRALFPLRQPVDREASEAAAIKENATEDYENPQFTVTPLPDQKFVTMYCRSAVNIRSQAGMGGSVIGALEEGDQVKVLSKNKGWYEIDFEGSSGYVYKDYLQSESGDSDEAKLPDSSSDDE